MKLFLGRLRMSDSGIAFCDPVISWKEGEKRKHRQSAWWWPIRRIFGFSGGRFILALIITDKPRDRRVEPEPRP